MLDGKFSEALNLAEDELRKLMLLEIDGYYLFEVLDSPRAPESKSFPSRSILCIIFALGITVFFSILSYIFLKELITTKVLVSLIAVCVGIYFVRKADNKTT